ncbi:hypothetical protein BZA05DRAFT_232484 [Tricharina praecox]|uniref:uncharacterized protein n=1 Tax=Tricharina praecox TaxID=43433 RepID=UPI002220EAFB|nr:uncharacterized protein BZA05DRAFT_232484 [Tricharina praecox]KAI5855193.1 hypothetical protein BZA05DRAFT_232484 [Tricharina praecox]
MSRPRMTHIYHPTSTSTWRVRDTCTDASHRIDSNQIGYGWWVVLVVVLLVVTITTLNGDSMSDLSPGIYGERCWVLVDFLWGEGGLGWQEKRREFEADEMLRCHESLAASAAARRVGKWLLFFFFFFLCAAASLLSSIDLTG